MLKKINLDYDFDRFLNADYSQSFFSCLPYQAREQQDIYDDLLEGDDFATTWSEDNTKLRQVWWNEDTVDFNKLGQLLGIEVKSVSSICQPPGMFIGLHRDMFFKFRKEYPDDTRTLVRANVWLQDWKPGHVLQYKQDGEWSTDTHWAKGDGWIWDSDIVHWSCNGGMKNKYSLQVSGFLLDSE